MKLSEYKENKMQDPEFAKEYNKMKEMTGGYIDRELALSHPFANGHYDHENANEHFIFGCETYKEWLETLPVVDAVEVVRCKDCENWQREWETAGGGHYCAMIDLTTEQSFFCADGERQKL